MQWIGIKLCQHVKETGNVKGILGKRVMSVKGFVNRLSHYCQIDASAAHCTVFQLLMFWFLNPAGGAGGGGHFRNFWVRMCRWDPGTLDLYHS